MRQDLGAMDDTRRNLLGSLGVALMTGGTFAWLFAGPGALASAERIAPAGGMFVLGAVLLWIAWIKSIARPSAGGGRGGKGSEPGGGEPGEGGPFGGGGGGGGGSKTKGGPGGAGGIGAGGGGGGYGEEEGGAGGPGGSGMIVIVGPLDDEGNPTDNATTTVILRPDEAGQEYARELRNAGPEGPPHIVWTDSDSQGGEAAEPPSS